MKMEKKLLPAFPKVIPELNYSLEEQEKVNRMNLKFFLVSTLFHKRIIENDLVYIKYKRSKKLEFMPLFSLTHCLVAYNDFIQTGDKEKLERFKKCVKQLLKRTSKTGKLNGWKHKKNLQLPGYPASKESYSALFNGRGLSVLLRYYQLSRTKKIETLIEQILNTFEVQSDEGGVMKKEKRNIWYLEYSYGNDTPIVYNGFMNSLLSLWEVSQYGPNQQLRRKARTLFNKGIATIKKNKEQFILKRRFLTWLRYDSNKLFFADGNYFKIEKDILKQLVSITGDGDLQKIYKEWKHIEKRNKWKAKVFEWFYYIHKMIRR